MRSHGLIPHIIMWPPSSYHQVITRVLSDENHLRSFCADLVHGAKDKQLRVKEPVRTHLICNPSRPLELDDIMLKMESSDNFCSSINGDHEDDVIEVYDDDDDDDVDHNRVGDSDDLDNVGLEHEEEVDSEVDNDDYRDYDDV
ncbi:hypothetical protein JHK87_010113 [Glycine soja]|nr:hypothetical protein JHK87_010113 [Glycine soja]